MNNKRVSIQDVADALGLSKTLVSMVMNGKGDTIKISKATQKRVLEKARQMNYTPNQFARGLRMGRSHTIGLIVPDISNPFYSRIARVMEDELSAEGYRLLICSTEENAEKEMQLIRMLQDRAADGIVLASTQKTSAEIAAISETGYPLLLIDRDFDNDSLECVSVDNKHGGEIVAEYFVKKKIKDPVVFTIGPSHISPLRDRLNGFTDTFRKKSKSAKLKVVEVPFAELEKAISEELEDLFSSKQKPDAIFTLNNNLAVHVLKSLRQMKVRIPEDVALVSFDDIAAFEITFPSVTAVAQPVDDIGREAVKRILFRIKSPDAPAEAFSPLPVEIVVRESC